MTRIALCTVLFCFGFIGKSLSQDSLPPLHPGGQAAWDKYMQEFCSKISGAIKSEGAVEMKVQFVVHVKGQISDIHVLYKSNGSDLERYAVQAIQDSGSWTPATVNDHKVAAYCVQTVKFSL